MNKVFLIGRLTKNPEMRTSESGKTITTFNLAVNKNYKNANDEYETDFLNCVSFDRKAKYVAQYITKGNQIAVFGRLQSRTYQAQDGSNRYITEVIVDEIKNLEHKTTNIQETTSNEHMTSSEIVNKAMNDEPMNFEDVSNDDDIFGLTDDDLPF